MRRENKTMNGPQILALAGAGITLLAGLWLLANMIRWRREDRRK
jgi:hypothetical protein